MPVAAVAPLAPLAPPAPPAPRSVWIHEDGEGKVVRIERRVTRNPGSDATRVVRRITRKDSVLKITQLVGKNVEPPKTYAQIVPAEAIPLAESVPLQLSEFDLHLLEMIQVRVP